MTYLKYQFLLKTLLKTYRSCSLLNQDGQLLYSKDQGSSCLTTTRLVAFQIIKKYLNPKVGDFFILNDPDNGGYQYGKIIFIAALNHDLYLIWDEDYPQINFKIPPTPLYDQGKKNEFVWQALVGAGPHGTELENFLTYQKYNCERILNQKELSQLIADTKSQQLWFKCCSEVFTLHFDNKTHGSFESVYRGYPDQQIKLRFAAEEKQNIRSITLDFTQTQAAGKWHAASHVVESALIKKIIDFYQLSEFLSQSILDKVRIVLPPRSVVSKAHSSGDNNFELQQVCSQLCEFNMQQLNSQQRKATSNFEYQNYLDLRISSDQLMSASCFTGNNVHQQGFEELVNKQQISLQRMKKIEGSVAISFSVNTSGLTLKVCNHHTHQRAHYQLKLNNQLLERGQYELKHGDHVEIATR